MTHDKQKLEYLMSQLKAGMKAVIRVDFASIKDESISYSKFMQGGRQLIIETNDYDFRLSDDYWYPPVWFDLDATAAANGIEWPEELKRERTTLDAALSKIRMLTLDEAQEFAIEYHKHGPSYTVSAWLKSKEEKLMFGDCEVTIYDDCILIEREDADARIFNVTPEQLIKLAEKIMSLQS